MGGKAIMKVKKKTFLFIFPVIKHAFVSMCTPIQAMLPRCTHSTVFPWQRINTMWTGRTSDAWEGQSSRQSKARLEPDAMPEMKC